jgi:hypothetical protein
LHRRGEVRHSELCRRSAKAPPAHATRATASAIAPHRVQLCALGVFRSRAGTAPPAPHHVVIALAGGCKR